MDAVTTANGTVFARDVANERADAMCPATVAALAREVAAVRGMTVTEVVGRDLVAQGLHMLHAVGQAATVPPRLVVLRYNGDPSSSGVVAVIGKVCVLCMHCMRCLCLPLRTIPPLPRGLPPPARLAVSRTAAATVVAAGVVGRCSLRCVPPATATTLCWAGGLL